MEKPYTPYKTPLVDQVNLINPVKEEYSATTAVTTTNHTPTMAPRVVRKSVLLTRSDIADWKQALYMAMRAENPKQLYLQEIFTGIASDALLTSQMNNRREQSISSTFEMKTPDGKLDERLTEAIRYMPVTVDVLGHIWTVNGTAVR